MKILIKNVTAVNADGKLPNVDILVDGERIVELQKGTDVRAERIIDGTGLYAFPGFCDIHCHLRDPGFTNKEDIVSGTKSAAAGGFTTVCCMPNTKPVTDNPQTLEYIINKAQMEGFAQVLPVGCITEGMKGKNLTDFEALKTAGAIALSDDGKPVEDDGVIIEAMEKAAALGIPLMLHEEDLKNREQAGGVANEGENATKAGLAGIPNAIEDTVTARDIFYAQKTGMPIHICHVSTAGSVELVRRAKAAGAKVTCETAPHYFSLTDAEVVDGNPNAKVNPPLRSEADRLAVVAGIQDGTIDAIATDHAPHTAREKSKGFKLAPFGLIGFETAFAAAVTHLVQPGKVALEDIVRLLCVQPREIIDVEGGKLAKGAVADIVLADTASIYTYQREDIVSKAENTPFIGKKLQGKIILTINKGRITYDRQTH